MKIFYCTCEHPIKHHHDPEDGKIGMFCSDCQSYCIVSPIFWELKEELPI